MIRRFSCEFVSPFSKIKLPNNIALYYTTMSPQSQAIMLVAKVLGIELQLKFVDMEKGEHLTPEFLKISPQQILPVIVDNGSTIYDSHAIAAYLCDSYANDDRLYPRESVNRALVNARLHFDTGYLLAQFNTLLEEVFVHGATEIPLNALNSIRKGLELMERFLVANGPFLCGDHLSIADITCISTLSSIDTFVAIGKPQYPKLTKWMATMKSFSFYELNKKAAEDIQEAIRNKLKENSEKESELPK